MEEINKLPCMKRVDYIMRHHKHRQNGFILNRVLVFAVYCYTEFKGWEDFSRTHVFQNDFRHKWFVWDYYLTIATIGLSWTSKSLLNPVDITLYNYFALGSKYRLFLPECK